MNIQTVSAQEVDGLICLFFAKNSVIFVIFADVSKKSKAVIAIYI